MSDPVFFAEKDPPPVFMCSITGDQLALREFVGSGGECSPIMRSAALMLQKEWRRAMFGEVADDL